MSTFLASIKDTLSTKEQEEKSGEYYDTISGLPPRYWLSQDIIQYLSKY